MINTFVKGSLMLSEVMPNAGDESFGSYIVVGLVALVSIILLLVITKKK